MTECFMHANHIPAGSETPDPFAHKPWRGSYCAVRECVHIGEHWIALAKGCDPNLSRPHWWVYRDSEDPYGSYIAIGFPSIYRASVRYETGVEYLRQHGTHYPGLLFP